MSTSQMPSRLSTSTLAAAALLVVALVGVWISSPFTALITVVVAAIMAPWGVGLGERIIVSAITASGVIAAVFAVLTAIDHSLPPVIWRIGLSLVVLAELVLLDRRRSAPIWPSVTAPDVIGIVAAVIFGALLLAPYAGTSEPTQLTSLLYYWDHSSHLPMFTQVMHTGSWNFSSLAPKIPGEPQSGVMFSVYPMLHVALWSVTEWIGGAGLNTPGTELVQPYIVLSGATAAFAVAILVWSAGLLAREFNVVRSEVAALIAATLVAIWCLNGSLSAMADDAFVNFLLAGAFTVGAIAVSLRNRKAITQLGWFVTPLGTLAVAYLYPPLAAGLAVAVAITWVTVFNFRRDRLLVNTIMIMTCLVLAVPSYQFVTAPFAGRSAGTIGGGIPVFGIETSLITVAITLTVLAAALTMKLRTRQQGVALALGLIAPIVLTGAIAALFYSQARAAEVELQHSYYTKKIIFALLMVTVPTATAIVGAAIVRVSGTRGWFTVSASVVAALVVLGLTYGSTDARHSLDVRQTSTHAGDVGGNTELLAAAHPSHGQWTTVTYFNHRIAYGPSAESLTVEAGRTAAALGNVLTWADNRVIEAVSLANPKDPAPTIEAMLNADSAQNLTLVVPDESTAAPLRRLSTEFGPQRFELLIANQ